MNAELIKETREWHLVIFAGAGVSMSAPSSLPGWRALNETILHTLRKRLEVALDRDNWLEDVETHLNKQRQNDQFPPDYQAQIIEEICGDRYFRGLQSLDVDVHNTTHDGIASLAAAGAVRAIITTNFDRLIEHSLEAHGVAYVAAIDDDGYRRVAEHLRQDAVRPVPVIKIHGSVSSRLSMIDTLKQRKKGRSRAIHECLQPLFSSYWLYLGFSAADLETDRTYLGLIEGATRGPGATYIAYRNKPKPESGADWLMAAYGEGRGDVELADTSEFLQRVCANTEVAWQTFPSPRQIAGERMFLDQLETWASTLSLAATGLCLAAVLEAAGQSEAAARVLDRLVRKEILEERGTADFQALQLHYGRLGAAFGRFFAVPDMNGQLADAAVECGQSLMRLLPTQYAFAASGWLICWFLWMNLGDEATASACWVINGFRSGQWDKPVPRTDEETVDAWLAAAQVLIVNWNERPAQNIFGTFEKVLTRARVTGDVVRTARVVSLYLLAVAHTERSIIPLAAQYDGEFDEVRRVGDGFAMGFRALALGRWYVGPGGLALALQTGDHVTQAKKAIWYLDEAMSRFAQQGMDPWILFAAIQRAKAWGDLQQLDAATEEMRRSAEDLARFPIFASHQLEAYGQIQQMTGDAGAAESFRRAVTEAKLSGLAYRHTLLLRHYGNLFGPESSPGTEPASS